MSDPTSIPGEALAFSDAEFQGEGGVRLYLRRWEPRRALRGVAVICHGGFEHGGRYGGLVAVLADRGFRCYSGDLRGCGRSGGFKGHVDSFGQYLGDLGRFLGRAAEENPGLPMVLIGHSMGGLLALMHLQKGGGPPLKAAVICAPLLRLAHQPPTWKTAVGKGLSKLMPRLRLAHGLEASGLSHDPDVVRGYDEDPLVFALCSTRWYTSMLEAMKTANEGPQASIPVLWLHGDADRVNHIDGTRSFLGTGTAGQSLLVYPGMFHELFNEVGRERVFDDVVSFLDSQISG